MNFEGKKKKRTVIVIEGSVRFRLFSFRQSIRLHTNSSVRVTAYVYMSIDIVRVIVSFFSRVHFN